MGEAETENSAHPGGAAAEFQVEGELFVGQLLEENRKLCLMGPCITGKTLYF